MKRKLLWFIIWLCWLAAFSRFASAQLACTQFYPAGSGQFGIYNKCDQCMNVSMAWCDGAIHRKEIRAHENRVIIHCEGTVRLVDEKPCDAPEQLACTQFYPAGSGQFGIHNKCDQCMNVSMAWCDGTIHRKEIRAHENRVIIHCEGTVTLVDEKPCQ